MSGKKSQTGFDEDEAVFINAFEAGDVAFRSTLTPERRDELVAMAKRTMADEREQISLRVPRTDLQKLKSRALQEGIPYQTLINALIHRYVTR